MAGYLRMRRQLMRSRGPGYSAEAVALFAAMTSEPTAERKTLIDTTIRSLKAAGLWAKTDALWMHWAHDQQAATLNWKNPGTNTATTSGAPTFTANRGFTTGGGSYVDLNWNAGTHGVQYTQDSAHLGLYCLTNSADTSYDALALANADGLNTIDAGVDSERVGINGAGTQNATGSGRSAPQHVVGVRPNNDEVSILLDGVLNDTGSGKGSTGVSSVDIVLGQFSDRQYGAFHIGAALIEAEVLAYYNILRTYAVAVGADT